MGQQVAALAYGVEVKEHKLQDEDGDWLAGKPDVRIESGENDYSCIALPVAVQNVPEDDEVELPECALEDIGDVLQDEIDRAKKTWKKIDAWAKSHRVVLGRPRLLIIMVERA